MQSLLVRSRSIRILGALAFTALPLSFVACGDDDPSGPGNGNGGPNLSLVASSLSDAAESLVTLSETQDALTGLSTSIGNVMSPGGFSVTSRDAPSLGTAPREGDAASPIFPVLARLGADERPATSPRLSVQPPLALGVTCVWGVQRDQYVGDGGENAFGAPRQDETFFELYVPDTGGTPVIPLQPIGGFTSVRPVEQGSVLDVEIFSEQDGEGVHDFVTQGTFSGPNTFDIQVTGSSAGQDGSTVLDFDVDLTPTVLQTSASVLDILLDENLSLTEVGTLVVAVDKTGTGAVSLVFTVQFDLQDPSFAITSGNVTLDGTTVATISGTLANPTITLSEGSPLASSDRSLLAGIFDDADILTGGIRSLLIIGSCIGTEDREFCSIPPFQPAQQG